MRSTLRAAVVSLVVAGTGVVSTASPFSLEAIPGRGERVADLAAPPRAQQQGQLPVYGASVEVVRLHAAVLDDGRPVTDLTAGDFVVIDNGVEHEVALALTPIETPIDVALVIDQSDSIRQGAPTVKRDARAFLDALGPDDCAFVLPFQHYVGPGIWGPAMAPSLLQIIDRARLEGGTSLNDAVIVGLSEVQRWNVPAVLAGRVATDYRQPTIEGGVGIDFTTGAAPAPEAEPDTPGFSRADLPFRVFPSDFGCGGADGATQGGRRKALVVLSDGVDTTSAHTFGELLGFVYQTDVPVFPVAIGHAGSRPPSENRESRRAARIAEGRLKKLAEITGGKYVVGSGSETRLREAYDQIITILRGSYLLGYYPPRADGTQLSGAAVHEHEVAVKVRRRGLEVFARTEYHRTASNTQVAHSAARLGAELVLAEELEGAMAAARRAVVADAELWDGHFLEATALWMDRRPQPALAALQRALWLEPGVAAFHYLAWQLRYDLGDDAAAWEHAIRAQLAGADMQEAMNMLAARSTPPEALEARLGVPRVFVEGPRSDDPAKYARLTGLVRALSRRVSDSPLLSLVRDPLAADYYLYVDADDPDRRRPRALASRLELYNYTDQRLWREDMDVADLEDAEQLAGSVDQTLARLEEWLLKGR